MNKLWSLISAGFGSEAFGTGTGTGRPPINPGPVSSDDSSSDGNSVDIEVEEEEEEEEEESPLVSPVSPLPLPSPYSRPIARPASEPDASLTSPPLSSPPPTRRRRHSNERVEVLTSPRIIRRYPANDAVTLHFSWPRPITYVSDPVSLASDPPTRRELVAEALAHFKSGVVGHDVGRSYAATELENFDAGDLGRICGPGSVVRVWRRMEVPSHDLERSPSPYGGKKAARRKREGGRGEGQEPGASKRAPPTTVHDAETTSRPRRSSRLAAKKRARWAKRMRNTQ